MATMIAARAEIERDLAPRPGYQLDQGERVYPKIDLFALVFAAVWAELENVSLDYPTVREIHRRLDRAKKRMRGPR